MQLWNSSWSFSEKNQHRWTSYVTQEGNALIKQPYTGGWAPWVLHAPLGTHHTELHKTKMVKCRRLKAILPAAAVCISVSRPCLLWIAHKFFPDGSTVNADSPEDLCWCVVFNASVICKNGEMTKIADNLELLKIVKRKIGGEISAKEFNSA